MPGQFEFRFGQCENSGKIAALSLVQVAPTKGVVRDKMSMSQWGMLIPCSTIFSWAVHLNAGRLLADTHTDVVRMPKPDEKYKINQSNVEKIYRVENLNFDRNAREFFFFRGKHG